jgi:hypothetical protein
MSTGIDYLGLVAHTHEEAAGTGNLDFSHLQMFTNDADEDNG